MKLFLASEAKHPDNIAALRTFINGFEGKSIAYIPTAANGETPFGSWKTDSDTWRLVQTLGAQVTPVVFEEYRNASVVDQLKGKDIIWFAGGMCGYLMYWIRRCELDKQLPGLLEAGSVFVGSSAGSMIAAPTLSITEWYMGEAEAGASIFPGLGFVDFEIFPHYEVEMLPEIKRNWKGEKLCLLKNNEAIIVYGDSIKFTGAEKFFKGGQV